MNTYDEIGQTTSLEHKEGKIARSIEHETAKLPSDLFLWAAGAAVVGSLALQISGLLKVGRKASFFARPSAPAPLASFVGMWVPSLLLLGVYNKIVKVAGSDKYTG